MARSELFADWNSLLYKHQKENASLSLPPDPDLLLQAQLQTLV